MIFLTEVGLRVKELRQKLNLTQEELARKAGYTSRSSINKIEKGLVDIPQSKIADLAAALETTPAYLMGWEKATKVREKTKESIAHNIRYHRELAKLTQKQFADILGVDEKIVAMLEDGQEELRKEILYKICDALDLIPGNIIPGDDEELDEDTKYLLSRRKRDRLSYIDLHRFSSVRPITRKRLPVLGNVACGEPVFANEEHDAYIDVDSDIAADFCLTAKGDSMVNARIFDGDILFVKKQDTVNDGEIAVVLIENEATVKRVYYDKENNILTLMPENPTHRPMRFEGEKLNQIRILGKIVFGQYHIEPR